MSYEFKLPDIGEGVVEGEIVKWLVSRGDSVTEDQPMVEVMTDKATVEIPSPIEGKIEECIGEEGETVQVGATLVVIQEKGGSAPKKGSDRSGSSVKSKTPPAPDRPPSDRKKSPSGVLATPAIRKRAREMEIDLAEVTGTGPGGRVTLKDLESFSSGVTAPAGAPAAGEVETIPYRGLRKRIGDRMSLSKRSAPHYTYVEEADVTDLVRLRKRFLQEKQSARLTYLPFIMKAVVVGLKEFRLLNATLDADENQIRLHRSYNIGVATATEEGLIVPVVRNVDRKTILELSEEVFRLADAARSGKVELKDLKDGTFTITSLGSRGGLLATPILNHPEVAILGVHKIAPRPVVRDGEVVIREMMNLSLSLDHRVVDGAVGAEFMQTILRFIENPGLLLLQEEAS